SGARVKPLYTALCSSLLFPLHERLKGHDSVKVRKLLEQTQWWPPQRIREYQLHKLRGLLLHAQTRVRYYRRLFDEIGFAPAEIKSLSELAQVHLLTKARIRDNVEELKADNARGLARFSTGGSSGEPLILFIGAERVSHDVAAKWRATRWWGVDVGDPEIVVWGSPIELNTQDRLRRFRDKLLRTKLLPAFEMSRRNLDSFLDSIRSARPRMLFGYPSALSDIARHAESKQQRMDDLGIKVAFVTAERLYDEQRQTIARVFGCAVANGYGGRDAGFVAHECPQSGMHISAEDIIVEIVDNHGKPLPAGEPGEIVVTHLATADFPFIRYRTGDVGVLDDRVCTCGRGLPLIRELQGRTTDFVIAADGTAMHGLALIYVLRELNGIRAFKIVQENLQHTRVLLIPAAGFDKSTGEKIREGIKARLGASVEVTIQEVAELPEEASGKFRYVVSHVPA
ncbi:MAG TPA: AMP-binding protein, partial [Burkholderiales bacterium]|nr:AMP-binding protein [Burkholderiales bacterium]